MCLKVRTLTAESGPPATVGDPEEPFPEEDDPVFDPGEPCPDDDPAGLLPILTQSNIFSRQSIVLATVPPGEPPPEETRNTPRSVSSPGEQASAAKPRRVRRLWPSGRRDLALRISLASAVKGETRWRGVRRNSLPL
jgi:hypothetical protein